jgi:hypothetical protein
VLRWLWWESVPRARRYPLARVIVDPTHDRTPKDCPFSGATEAAKWSPFQGRQLRSIPLCGLNKSAPQTIWRETSKNVTDEKRVQSLSPVPRKYVEIEKMYIMRA